MKRRREIIKRNKDFTETKPEERQSEGMRLPHIDFKKQKRDNQIKSKRRRETTKEMRQRKKK